MNAHTPHTHTPQPIPPTQYAINKNNSLESELLNSFVVKHFLKYYDSRVGFLANILEIFCFNNHDNGNNIIKLKHLVSS